MSIRMLGIDTPELHFPQGRDVALMDKALAALPRSRAWKKLPAEFRALVRMTQGQDGFHYRVRDLRSLGKENLTQLSPYDYVHLPE